MTNTAYRVLLAAIPTGRPFGNKVEEKRSSMKIGGAKVAVIENDSWEGGDGTAEIHQQYHRLTWIEFPKVRFNHA